MRLKITIEERGKASKTFEDQAGMLGKYGEINSDFLKVFNILKTKGDNTSWSKIDFLEKISDIKDPEQLIKEIERIKVEKGVIGNELEKTKNLLALQQGMNDDQSVYFENEKKILKNNLNKALKKVDELSKLVDVERHAHIKDGVYRKDQKYSHLVKDLTSSVYDALTEFSVDDGETEFGNNENALDIYLGEGAFEDSLGDQLGIPLENIMTMLSIDFFIHETQTSNLISGKTPQYNMQIAYRVNLDEQFIDFVNNEHVILDFYFLRNSVQTLFGHGYIPLKQIVDIEEKDFDSRVCYGICQVTWDKDSNIIIGSIHYKMRLRFPILKTLKWMKEKQQIIKEISPIEEAKAIQRDASLMTKGSKKAVNFTIMIKKGVGLKVGGQPRKIMPYVFFQFYRADEHFTRTSYGNDPVFEDCWTYKTVSDTQLYRYLEKERLQLLVLDDSKELELQFSGQNAVDLVQNPENDDLIGYAFLPLKELLLKECLDISLPVSNRSNSKCGEIVITAYMEEISSEYNASRKYDTSLIDRAYIEGFAQCMIKMQQTQESAFELLKEKGKEVIGKHNFQSVVIFTFKYTEKQNEVEQLIRAVFGTKEFITKYDFDRMFSQFLPSASNIQTQPHINTINVVDKRAEADLNKSLLEAEVRKSEENVKTQEQLKLEEQQRILNSIQSLGKKDSLNDKSSILAVGEAVDQSKHLTSESNIIHKESDKGLIEIVAEIHDFMGRKKMSYVDLFKSIDRNNNTSLDKQELFKGLLRIGISISSKEFEKLWKEISKGEKSVSFTNFKNLCLAYLRK